MDYLSERPYKEVEGFIPRLRNLDQVILTQIDEEKPEKSPANE